MSRWVGLLTGPALYARYRRAGSAGQAYRANFVEEKADYALWAASALRTLCVALSPLLLPYLYSRGLFSTPSSVARLALYLGSFYAVVLVARGLGRAANPSYTAFLGVLARASAAPDPANIRALREFDSEFFAWPVSFRAKNRTSDGQGFRTRSLPKELVERGDMNPLLWQAHGFLCWLAAQTFAGWMLYPGSLRLYNLLLLDTLNGKRRELVEAKGGLRAKVRTAGGLDIDTMFVDRRNRPGFPQGNRLVITCEGNAGFYEIGCMETALGAGFSVLGWNHPGFGGSTGTPWPEAEGDAVASVVELAERHLGFPHSEIIVLAWSIGGHSATWAGMNFPSLGGLVLDATFDDLVPLALPRMPQAWDGLVRRAVRQYWDLPVLRQLRTFPGPVTIVRRTKDEIIVTDETSDQAKLKTNRSKQLLLGLLVHRFPSLMARDGAEAAVTELFDQPEHRDQLVREAGDWAVRLGELVALRPEPDQPLFPLGHVGPELPAPDVRRLALYLAAHYMKDFDSVHCNPLPASFLTLPRHPWETPDP